nr:ABC-F family ATP-binding cassette domain-containing protein [Clostridia bacterium]
MLEMIVLDDILPSSRRYPYTGFTPEREIGKDVLFVDGISKTVNGEKILSDVTFTMNREDKIVFMSRSEQARTLLFQILMGEGEPDAGTFRWGTTTSRAYLPKDINPFFDGVELNLIDWIRQYSPDDHENFCRGFLGKMLFSGDEALKQASVLSGGEKMRCMFSRLMLSSANILLLDEPTNHLDLESITAVNNGLIAFKGAILFTSHDYEFIQTIANRVIELTPNGIVDSLLPLDEYLVDENVQNRLRTLYGE